MKMDVMSDANISQVDRLKWFAATLPSECLNVIMLKMAVHRHFDVLYADASRAYSDAAAARHVYVQLSEEDKAPNDMGKCGSLHVSMYGTRDAAMNWATANGKNLRKQDMSRENRRCAFSLTELRAWLS